jgi:predicted dehydrogenase
MKIRVGVVGIGHLGNYHLQKYNKLPDSEIVGVADSVEERARSAAKEYGCEAVYDHRDLIGKVDAVSVAVPTGLHHKVAKDFLQSGIDVLLEKPITKTIEEADELVSIAAEKGAILQIGFVERFNPAIVSLGAVIESPLFIESHRLHPFGNRGTDVDVVLDLMIHDLDIILQFVKSEVLNVEAVGVSVLSNNIDIANVRITFQNGCVANITASRVTAKKLQKIRFFGLEGYHSVDYGKRELMSLGRRSGADGQIEIVQNDVTVTEHDPLEEEIKSFLNSVIKRSPPLVSGEDGRESLKLALSIIEKMKTDQGIIQ